MMGCGATFLPFVKNGGLLDPNFEKKYFWDYLHKEDNLGIILSPISGL